ELDVQVFELLRVDWRGGFGHEALGLLRFGEGDHVADRVGPAEEHDKAVQTKGDPAMGRRPVLQRFQEETKLCRRFLLADPKKVEELALHIAPVNADAAAADLVAIEHHIISLRASL